MVVVGALERRSLLNTVMKEDQHEEVADPNLAAFPKVASAIFGNLPLRKRRDTCRSIPKVYTASEA